MIYLKINNKNSMIYKQFNNKLKKIMYDYLFIMIIYRKLTKIFLEKYKN